MFERGTSDGVQAQGEVEFAKKRVLRRILSRAAMERLGRIAVVRPEVAAQLESYLVSLYKAGKVKGEISEEQMKMILGTVSVPRDFKIVRK